MEIDSLQLVFSRSIDVLESQIKKLPEEDVKRAVKSMKVVLDVLCKQVLPQLSGRSFLCSTFFQGEYPEANVWVMMSATASMQYIVREVHTCRHLTSYAQLECFGLLYLLSLLFSGRELRCELEREDKVKRNGICAFSEQVTSCRVRFDKLDSFVEVVAQLALMGYDVSDCV